MAARGAPPKGMSSRLAAMKFMQRTAPASVESSSEPAPKKQRLSYENSPTDSPQGSAKQSPAAGGSQRYSNDGGDGEWYLSFNAPHVPAAESPLRIVSAGFASLDHSDLVDDTSDREQEIGTRQSLGRKSFGAFNKNVAGKQNSAAETSEEDSDSEAGDGEQEGDTDRANLTGVNALIAQGRKEAAGRIREERKAKRKADSAEFNQLGEIRRKKEVNLNKMTGISSGGTGPTRGGLSSKDATCYTCGGKGHIKRDCPKAHSNGSKPRKSF